MKHLMTAAILGTLLAACATGGERVETVTRMFVIDCGENHVRDVSRWTPGVNAGRPHVFGNHCYLIRHAKGWMLWDSGNADRIAALPNGLTAPSGMITAIMRKPLVESLRQIGLAPADIGHFAMSHSHGDHDVFGDGSVLIKATPGHTPRHQVLVVNLPRTGRVILSGDMVHLRYSWENRVVPSFNFDIPWSGRSIDQMKDYAAGTGAKIWINHDKEQHAAIPKAPAYVE